jgi:uncharacterized protein (DUF952 family)
MLYHLVSRSLFERQPAHEPYFPASLAEEGFIHLSATPEQVAWVAKTFYGDVLDLVVLVIDESRLTAPVRYDQTADGVFPHLYGPLERDAIVAIEPATTWLG